MVRSMPYVQYGVVKSNEISFFSFPGYITSIVGVAEHMGCPKIDRFEPSLVPGDALLDVHSLAEVENPPAAHDAGAETPKSVIGWTFQPIAKSIMGVIRICFTGNSGNPNRSQHVCLCD
jgi:hypothetical protein